MTLEQMIAQAREALAAAIATRTQTQDALMSLRSDPNLTEDAVTQRTQARDAADAVVTQRAQALDDLVAEQAREAEVVELQSRATPTGATPPAGGARVTSEPEVYRRGGNESYFRDLFRAQHMSNRDSIDRLVRNDRAMADNVEYRALTTTDGAGGDFVPPLWMVGEFIELARAGRVAADQIRGQNLPAGTDSISLPRLATGTAVAAQATQNTQVQSTDATTNSVTAAVETIAGEQVVAQQLLDQSPINMDDILLADLAADYAIKADVFVINNNATNKVGLLNVTGNLPVTYTSGAPTLGGLYAKIADGIQQVHTNRLMPPDKILMHPRRWGWITAALDSAGRPMVTADTPSNNPAVSVNGVLSAGYVGVIQGLPVYTDPNLPITLNTNQDPIIILRSVDSIFFESAPKSETFRETLARQLSVLLRFYAYAAIHASRYPKSIAVITGTGMATPVF
jgi:HK97 family phage major capsid protein